ncbi:MAG: flagellar hook capping protein [Peptococcaceae bacterium]|nr:flagellar hook capping protein [Peptococcaceae bacterium]
MAVNGVNTGVVPDDLLYTPGKRTANKTLDKDAFLQLFILSLKNQDPTNTQDPNDFMAQMAQFSILEQLTNMNSEISKMKLATEMDQASGLIGRSVVINAATGVEIEGVVERITAYQGELKVYLKDIAVGFDLYRVTEVY